MINKIIFFAKTTALCALIYFCGVIHGQLIKPLPISLKPEISAHLYDDLPDGLPPLPDKSKKDFTDEDF